MTPPVYDDWAYDPEWRYFVRGGGKAGASMIAFAETVHRDIADDGGWAPSLGLSAEVVERLVANPTPGAYKGSGPPKRWEDEPR